MDKFVKFSDIGQFRNIIKDVVHTAQYKGMDDDDNVIMDRTIKAPIVTFTGTVKLHGTNAGVGMTSDGKMWFQSRKNVITPEKDNAGFAFFANSNAETFKSFFDNIRNDNTEIKDKKPERERVRRRQIKLLINIKK